jgi:hypothetical protein
MLYDEHLKYKDVEEGATTGGTEVQTEKKKLEIINQPDNKKKKGCC